MAEKDELGRRGEERAARYFADAGYEVVARNWRCAAGEIDLVAVDTENVIIVEVKTRRGEGFGHPFEAIDARKRARLWRLACAWVAVNRDVVQRRRLRIDAVAIVGADPGTARLEHLRDLEVP